MAKGGAQYDDNWHVGGCNVNSHGIHEHDVFCHRDGSGYCVGDVCGACGCDRPCNAFFDIDRGCFGHRGSTHDHVFSSFLPGRWEQ